MLQQGGIRVHLLTRNSLRSVCGSCATIASISPELSPGNKRANRHAIPDCLKGEGHHNTPPPLVTACRQNGNRMPPPRFPGRHAKEEVLQEPLIVFYRLFAGWSEHWANRNLCVLAFQPRNAAVRPLTSHGSRPTWTSAPPPSDIPHSRLRLSPSRFPIVCFSLGGCMVSSREPR